MVLFYSGKTVERVVNVFREILILQVVVDIRKINLFYNEINFIKIN